jgi:hypothetical protein
MGEVVEMVRVDDWGQGEVRRTFGQLADGTIPYCNYPWRANESLLIG